MNILTFTTLFPNAINPLHAVFVRARVLAVAKRCNLTVVAPVPYFPKLPVSLPKKLKRYEQYAYVPKQENQFDLSVYHPRFLTLPHLGKSLDGHFLFHATKRKVAMLHRNHTFDLIDAHWAYPDGFAAAQIAKYLHLPLTLTVRGDDLSSIPNDPGRKTKIVQALQYADRVIAVCSALRDEAIALGVSPDKAIVIGNGIDLSCFSAMDRKEARLKLGLPLSAKILLSVGHLCERKGFHLLIDAVSQLYHEGMKDLCLAIVGGGGEEGDISAMLHQKASGLPPGTILLPGPKPPQELSLWYSAADLFCLASSREGWANVLLEALACGTPVVGTNVWGIPEVISSPQLGILTERTPQALAQAIHSALRRTWSRETLIAHAKGRTWDHVAAEVYSVFEDVLNGSSP